MSLFKQLEELADGLEGKAEVATNPNSAHYQNTPEVLRAAAKELRELLDQHQAVRIFDEAIHCRVMRDTASAAYIRKEFESLREGIKSWPLGTLKVQWNGFTTKNLNVDGPLLEAIVMAYTCGKTGYPNPKAHSGHWAAGPGGKRVWYFDNGFGEKVFNTHPIGPESGGYYDWRAMLLLKGENPDTYTCLQEG